MIHFLLDIDGTLAERNTSVFMALCNKKLKLGIDDTRLQTLSYHDFLTQPEVISYRQRLGESNFERALGWIELDPQHQIRMLPLKDAVAGVSRLANLGPLAYYSMRKTASSEQLNTQMAQATRIWLTMHQFPNTEHVLFCSNAQDKLYQIIEQAVKNSSHLILIDGCYEPLLADLSALNTFMVQRIQCSLTLCAFGVVEVARSATFETVAFPAWKDIDSFIQACINVVEKKVASPYLSSRGKRPF